MIVHYRSRLARLILKPFGFAAITIGRHIFTWREALSSRDLAHERCHVAQWARYGWLGFLIRYCWHSVRHGYQKNPLEVEARQAEEGA